MEDDLNTTPEQTANTGTEGQVSETTSTENASADTGEQDTGTENTGAEGTEGSESEGEATPPAYAPNYKYRGAEQDKEIPEFLRSLIKDEATEKEVKTLLAKADGLDIVKQRQEVIRGERDTHKNNFESLTGQVNDARETYQRGDIDLFLQKLDIPQERMLQWALEKVNYSKLPPEQQKVLDDKRALERQTFENQKVLKSTQQQQMSREAEYLQTSLKYELARPEVTEFQNAFDSAVGKPGAFLEEVKTRGELAWTRSGGKTILPVNQVIQDVMTSYANFGKKAAPVQGTANAAPAAPVATTAAKKPATTIPNVSGKSASPLNNKPKNLDELRAMAKKAGADGSF
jgi:hypothetical protein